MTTRRHISARERVAIFAANDGRCHICLQKIDAGRERWDVEHVIPLEMGGDEEKGSENLKPAHASCHRQKTRQDAANLAKAKRQEQRTMGIARQSRNPLPGSRDSKWKQKLTGEWVLR